MQFPSLKERGPIDVIHQFAQGPLLFIVHAGLGGLHRAVRLPIGGPAFGAGLFQTQHVFGSGPVQVAIAHGFLVLFVANRKFRALFWTQQGGHHRYRAAGIQNMDHRSAVNRGNFDRGMGLGGGSPPNQQRNLQTSSFHLAGNPHHFVQGRRNQPRQSDDIYLVFQGGFEYTVGGNHHPQIHHFVIIALKNDPDNVFADIVHIALNRRHQDASFVGCLTRFTGSSCALLLGFEVRQQNGHRFFHNTGAFDHLRQKHFAFPKQISYDVHSVHQRAFNQVKRLLKFQAGLFDIFGDKFVQAFDQRVGKSFSYRFFTP